MHEPERSGTAEDDDGAVGFEGGGELEESAALEGVVAEAAEESSESWRSWGSRVNSATRVARSSVD